VSQTEFHHCQPAAKAVIPSGRLVCWPHQPSVSHISTNSSKNRMSSNRSSLHDANGFSYTLCNFYRILICLHTHITGVNTPVMCFLLFCIRKGNPFRIQKRRKIFEVLCDGTHSLYGALSWWGLDPIQLAYNRCWLDDRLTLTASTFNRLQLVRKQSWLQGTLLHRTCHFFPSGSWNHRQLSAHCNWDWCVGNIFCVILLIVFFIVLPPFKLSTICSRASCHRS